MYGTFYNFGLAEGKNFSENPIVHLKIMNLFYSNMFVRSFNWILVAESWENNEKSICKN